MKIESHHLESAAERSPLDRELDALEKNDLEPLERARLSFLCDQEVFGSYDHFEQQNVEKRFPERGGRFRHFFLPSNMGVGFDGSGDSTMVREGFDRRHHYFASSERAFVRIDQGGLWIVPRDAHPHLYFGMSECTALVGYTEDQIVAAHIGFSEYQELQPALELLKQNGVAMKDAYVVASVGQTQRNANERAKEIYSGVYPRPVTIEDYEALGLKDENITAFAFRFGKRLDEKTDHYHSLGRALATNDFIYNCTNDYTVSYRRSGSEMRLEEDPTNEHIFDLRNACMRD